MLRRFEIYTLAAGVSPDKVRDLDEAFRRCGEFIPELTHSVVGTNLSDQPIHMVWEHSYESPEAYQRYMVHPYHANVLDRYLLNDCPERIVTESVLGDGVLVGYVCESPIYYMKEGVRKVVLLGLSGPSGGLMSELRHLADTVEGVVLSVVEPNTMGVAWFDGVSPILPPSQWTHVWELGFESMEAYEAYQRSDSPLARAERDGWTGEGVVKRAVEMHYVVNET
jgi:hypothetical protein